MQRFLIWCGVDLRLPVQFHVGYGDSDVDLHRCNPLLLTPLLRAIQPTGVPVMLLHNYPYHREAGYLAQVFPHVYVDAGLATHNLGARAPALLAEALELAPFGKFLYSSDAFGLPELFYLGAALFRSALSSFLRTGLNEDLYTERSCGASDPDALRRQCEARIPAWPPDVIGVMKLLSVNLGQPRPSSGDEMKRDGHRQAAVRRPGHGDPGPRPRAASGWSATRSATYAIMAARTRRSTPTPGRTWTSGKPSSAGRSATGSSART